MAKPLHTEKPKPVKPPLTAADDDPPPPPPDPEPDPGDGDNDDQGG